MASPEIENYIKSARSVQIPEEDIKAQLAKKGLNENEISEVLNPKLNTALSMPSSTAGHIDMWVSFQYILLFITLYIWAVALGGIAYHAVNKLLPDKLDYRYALSSAGEIDKGLMKGYLSAIIVAYPIFAIIFLRLKKLALLKPYTKNLRSRKFLIYITLIITFLIFITQIISIIYGFLDGNISSRSIAYLAVNLSIAGSIFVYLLHEVREDRKQI